MNIQECKGCRQRKEIVFATQGLQYCEKCKDKAPTLHTYNKFLREKRETLSRFCNTHRPDKRKVDEFSKQ